MKKRFIRESRIVIHKRVTIATIAGLTAALALTACGGNGETALNTSSSEAVTQDLSQADPQAAEGDAEAGDAEAGDAEAGDGYGSSDGGSSDGYGASAEDSAAAAGPGRVTTVLRAKKTKTMGTIVVNQFGRTLYRFDQDEDNPPESTCTGKCLQQWPVALAPKNGRPRLQGVPAGLVGTVELPDGRTALTLKGWTLYEFFKDEKEGDWFGHEVKDVWFAIQPNGKKAPSCKPAARSGGSAPADSGKADSGKADSGSAGGDSGGYSY